MSYIPVSQSMSHRLTSTPEQKKRLLKAKIACALQDELGRIPKEDEITRSSS